MAYVYAAVVYVKDHYHVLIPDFILPESVDNKFCVVDLGDEYEDYQLRVPTLLEKYELSSKRTPIMIVRSLAIKYLRRKALTLNNLVDIVQVTVPDTPLTDKEV